MDDQRDRRKEVSAAAPVRHLSVRLTPAEYERIQRAAAQTGQAPTGWAKASLLRAVGADVAGNADLAVIEARLAWIGSCLQAYADGRVVPRLPDAVEKSAADAISELRLLLLELSARRHSIPEGNA